MTTGMFYSQFSEDRILHRIFSGKSRGLCVEVGANDGVHGSNTLFFEKLGWQCILIEPNPVLCAQIRAQRNATLFECAASSSPGTATLHVVEGTFGADGMSTISAKAEDRERIAQQGFSTKPLEVSTSTMDQLLEQAQLDGDIDFVTIDVEGHEMDVLRGFTLDRWKPTILIVEDNSNDKDNTVARYLAQFGYEPFRRTGVNDWFAHRSNRQLVNSTSKIQRATKIFELRARDRLRRIPWLRTAYRRLKGLPNEG